MKKNDGCKKTSKPFYSAFIVSFCILLSRFTGLVRDIFFAKYLGSGAIAEAFYVAFRLPNTFRRIFAEGAFSNAFVPFFTSKVKENCELANNFSFKVFCFLASSLVVLTIFFEIFMPFVVSAINPGFLQDEKKFLLAVQLSRICFPYVILISLASFFGSILQSVGRFAPFSLVSVILNIVVVIGLLVTKSFFSNVGFCLSWVLIFAGIFQLLFVMWFCVKNAVVPKNNSKKLSLELNEENKKDLRSFIKKFLPAVVSSGILQINIFVDGIFASFFAGAVSYLYYADRLVQFPMSIIGYSLSVAILPSLSVAFKAKNIDEVASLQVKSMKVALFFSIPAMLLFLSSSQKIVSLIFERGAFTATDTKVVANMLMIFAISVPMNILLKIFFACFYSQKDTKTPMKISWFGLVFNVVANLVLFKIIGMYCVVVATSASSVLSCLCAVIVLKSGGNFFIKKKDFNDIFLVFVASILSCFVVPVLCLKANIFLIFFISGFIYLALCFKLRILTKDFIKEVFNKKSCK